MHALMSVDPDARALRFWEVMYPSPPPGVAGADDPRRARADADWREINAKMPKWLHSHPYNDMLGDGLPEDERTWAFDFRVMTPTAWWRVPMQTVVGGLPTDDAAQYRIHKAMLQQFQYRRPRKYWVLKGFHGFRLKEFFETYPDASLLWLHRDPVQVAASRTMMMADILEGIVGPDRPAGRGEDAPGVDAREHRQHDDQPAGATIRGSCTSATPISSPTRWAPSLATTTSADGCSAPEPGGDARLPGEQPGDRHGKFHYSTELLTDIGEDLDALHEEFRPFRERFGVAIEKRK